MGLLLTIVFFLGPDDPRTVDPRWAAVEDCGGYIDGTEAVFPHCTVRCEDALTVELGEGYEPEPVTSVVVPVTECSTGPAGLVLGWE